MKSQYSSASTLLTLPVHFYTAPVAVTSEKSQILSTIGLFPVASGLSWSLQAFLPWLADWLFHVVPADRPKHLYNSASLRLQIFFVEPSGRQSCGGGVGISADLNGLFRAPTTPFQRGLASSVTSR